MDEILLFLFKQGATHPACISTRVIGQALGMSQQNASRRLIELEKAGLVERKDRSIILTKKGLELLTSLYRELKVCFENASSVALVGRVVPGLQEGAYYLSLPGYRIPLRHALGFDPYPGTLNIRLDSVSTARHRLLSPDGAIFIKGFRWKNRTFGGLYAYPCRIEGISGALLRPVRTHHGGDIAELIAPVSLKKKLKKKDGDEVKVVL